MLFRTHNALKATYQAPISRPLDLIKLSVFPTYCFRFHYLLFSFYHFYHLDDPTASNSHLYTLLYMF